jgi:hypothetical protein
VILWRQQQPRVVDAQALRVNQLVDGGPVGVAFLDEPEESTVEAVLLDSTYDALPAFDRWPERQRRRNAKELPSGHGAHSSGPSIGSGPLMVRDGTCLSVRDMKNGFYASLRRSHQP